MNRNYIIRFIIILALIFAISCKKAVNVDPPVTAVDGPIAYSSDINATAVLTGLYMTMSGGGSLFTNYINGITIYVGLSADELIPAYVRAGAVIGN